MGCVLILLIVGIELCTMTSEVNKNKSKVINVLAKDTKNVN